jgi:ribosomal protein S18 acetylase RimI-like enzyme
MAENEITIRTADNLSAESLRPLVTESNQQGWKFVTRLSEEFASGANKFSAPGEALFVATVGEAVVGVCGLNIDPYAAQNSTGRVRHLYVLSRYRSRSVGQRLVQAVMSAARGRFSQLRVRTGNPQAARLYERLGFHRTVVPECTHVLDMTKD